MWLHESGRRYAPGGEDPVARTTTIVPKRSRGVSSVPTSAVIWNHGCTLPALWIHISFTLADGFDIKDDDELLSKSSGDGTFTWTRPDEIIISDNSPSDQMLGTRGLSFKVIALNKNLHCRFINPAFYWSSKKFKRKPSCNYPNSGCISPPKNLTNAEKKNRFYMSISIYISIYVFCMCFIQYFIIYVRNSSHNLFTHYFFIIPDGGCVADRGHAGSNRQVQGLFGLELLAASLAHI